MALSIPCTGQELIEEVNYIIDTLNIKNGVIPIEVGGTGAENAKDARENLEVYSLNSYFQFIAAQNTDTLDAAFGKNNEDLVIDIGKQMAMYAWFKGANKTGYPFTNLINCSKLSDFNNMAYMEIFKSVILVNIMKSSPYILNNYFDKHILEVSVGQTYITNFTKSTQVNVTKDDLEAGFHLYCNFQGGNATSCLCKISINGITAVEGLVNKSNALYRDEWHDWKDYGITSPGTYNVVQTIDSNGASYIYLTGYAKNTEIIKKKG